MYSLLLHTLKRSKLNKINTWKNSIVLWNARENLADFDVFIIDTIGILTKIYSWHRLWVVVSGNPWVHNLLEPATFESQSYWSKLFSFCGSYSFSQHGCISVSNKTELIAAFKDLIVDTNYRSEKVISVALLFKWIKATRNYYEEHSIKYSKINQLRSKTQK
jgi:3-deoxy-D-manno-octulosonic-acid transferase